MLEMGGMRALIAVTTTVVNNVARKNTTQISISPSVLATITMKATDTVENPVAIMAASFAE